jgi:hypothetical protein
MQQKFSNKRIPRDKSFPKSCWYCFSMKLVEIHCPHQDETLWMTFYHINKVCWHWYLYSRNTILCNCQSWDSPPCTFYAWFFSLTPIVLGGYEWPRWNPTAEIRHCSWKCWGYTEQSSPKKVLKYMKWQHENFIWSTNSWKIINVDSYYLTQISSLYIHDRIIYVLPTLDKNVKKQLFFVPHISLMEM